MTDNQGWIAIHRQLQDSAIWFKPPEWLKIWLYILLNVSYEDKRFKRGTYFFRYQWIADNTGTTYNQVEKCISWLKSSGTLATRKATQGTLITVLNFAKFQDIKENKSDTKSRNQSEQKRHESDNITNNITIKQETNNIYTGKFFEDIKFKEAYSGFKEMRKKKNKPLTLRAEQIIIGKLENYTLEVATKMLDNATEQSWSSVYPLKENLTQPSNTRIL